MSGRNTNSKTLIEREYDLLENMIERKVPEHQIIEQEKRIQRLQMI